MRAWLILFLAVVAGCKAEPKKPADPPATKTKAPVSVEAAPGPPVRQAQPVEMRGWAKRLREWVTKAGLADPREPWMLAHGLIAFGKDLKVGKEDATDVIVRDFLETHEVDGKVAYRSFPATRDKTPVEPHRNLIIKSMLEAGVPLDRKFALKKGGVTLDELVSDAERVFVTPSSEVDWRNFAWTFDAFVLARGDAGKIKAGDEEISLKELALRTIHRVEAEQAFLVEHLEANRPDKVEKRKQAIFGHTCGGIHLVEAGIHAAGYLNDPNTTRLMRKQIAILLFRWDAERRIYKKFAGTKDPAAGVLITIQELKFYGHILEALAMAKEAGIIEADPAMRLEVQHIAGDLLDTLARMERLYDKAEELRKVRVQSYYDLIGDGCHAIRGLEQALVAFFPDSIDEKLK